ncbi:helix-turn-helix domain-containing protein [Kitasatospora sp. NPDC057015]|uniref:helix-turn-helix domain-containing protein n=1 Tax=Kitasatospora sp. NPDC057015 TaxID=3346001 RepID=UPI00363CF312
MGRPERPVSPHADKETAALAVRLRAHRRHAGHSYARLAELTEMTTTRLSRAASGDSVPPLAVAVAYARGCGAGTKDIAEIGKLWRAARRATHADQPERLLHITLVGDARDLWSAMLHLYLRVGRPPLRELERRADGYGVLPRSTLNMVLRGLARPSRTVLEYFVRACGVSKTETQEWLNAWDRVNHPRASDKLMPRRIAGGEVFVAVNDPGDSLERLATDEARARVALAQARLRYRRAHSTAERQSAHQQGLRVQAFLDQIAVQKSAATTSRG